MKKQFVYLLIFLCACGSESGIPLGKPDTFVRYYNGGSDDFAQAVLQTSEGGYAILSYSQIKKNDVSQARYKAKLTLTDAYGQELDAPHLYPEFKADSAQNSDGDYYYVSYQAHGMAIIPDVGYVLVGEDIQSDQTRQLLVLVVGKDGSLISSKSFPATAFGLSAGTNIIGQGVTMNTANGNYFVLGVTDDNTNNMVYTEISKSDLAMVWRKPYGAGSTTLANKFFVDAQSNLVAGGSVVKGSEKSKIRYVSAPVDAIPTADLSIGQNSFNQIGTDIALQGQNYVLTGSTDQEGNFDILYTILDQSGNEFRSFQYPVEELPNKNETGNAIATTQDGGVIILATISSSPEYGRGEDDYYLLKIDAGGGVQWRYPYGSKFTDTGVAVLQAADGGYVALGTTQLGGTRTVMLMKTDRNGQIQ